MIRSYIEGKQRYWDKDLALLVIALHSTLHRQTGFTPNRLMLGREVSQQIEILLGVADKNIQSRTPVEWVDNLCTELTRTHQVVQERLKSTQRRQKKDYNLRGLREKSYDVGDLVYKRDQSTKIGVSSKLQSPYKGPYLVVKAQPPVYAIQDRKRESVVHHDKLLPCRSSEIPFWLKRKRHQLFSNEEPNPLEILEETILGLTDESISTRSAETHVQDESTSVSDPPVIDFPCGKCALEATADQDAIQCDGSCDKWFHLKCSDLTSKQFNSLMKDKESDWMCKGCLNQRNLNLDQNRPKLRLFPGETELLRDERCVGLGEVGLDYSGNCRQHLNSQCDCTQNFHDQQKKFLREVLPWAKELNKTLVIHCRGRRKEDGSAASDVLAILQELGLTKLQIYRHCFLGTEDELKEWLRVCPNAMFGVTAKEMEASDHRRVVQQIPLEKLLIESDAPYLAPSQVQVVNNSPWLCSYTVATLAQLTGQNPRMLLQQCNSNARQLYGW